MTPLLIPPVGLAPRSTPLSELPIERLQLRSFGGIEDVACPVAVAVAPEEALERSAPPLPPSTILELP